MLRERSLRRPRQRGRSGERGSSFFEPAQIRARDVVLGVQFEGAAEAVVGQIETALRDVGGAEVAPGRVVARHEANHALEPADGGGDLTGLEVREGAPEEFVAGKEVGERDVRVGAA